MAPICTFGVGDFTLISSKEEFVLAATVMDSKDSFTYTWNCNNTECGTPVQGEEFKITIPADTLSGSNNYSYSLTIYHSLTNLANCELIVSTQELDEERAVIPLNLTTDITPSGYFNHRKNHTVHCYSEEYGTNLGIYMHVFKGDTEMKVEADTYEFTNLMEDTSYGVICRTNNDTYVGAIGRAFSTEEDPKNHELTISPNTGVAYETTFTLTVSNGDLESLKCIFGVNGTQLLSKYTQMTIQPI